MASSFLMNYIIEIIGGVTILILGIAITIFIIFPKYRNDKFEIIFFMFISSFFTTIGYMFIQERQYVNEPDKYPDIDSNICQLQAFLISAFEPGVFLFSAILSYYIKESVDNIDSGNKKITTKRRIIHGLIGFFAPFGIALFAYAQNTFGYVHNYCWITRNHAYSTTKEDKNQKVISYNERALYFQIIIYVIEYCSVGVCLFFYISIIYSFYKNARLSKEELNSIKKTIWLNLRYPIIQLGFLIPSSLIIIFFNQTVPNIDRIPDETDEYQKGLKRTLLYPLLMCIHGLLLCILYVWSLDLYHKLRHKNSSSKAELYNSVNTVGIKQSQNTITGSLLNPDKDTQKYDYDIDDIGNGYMN